jgi:hypothetical protein
LQLENQMIKINDGNGLLEKPVHQWVKEALEKLIKGGDPCE